MSGSLGGFFDSHCMLSRARSQTAGWHIYKFSCPQCLQLQISWLGWQTDRSQPACWLLLHPKLEACRSATTWLWARLVFSHQFVQDQRALWWQVHGAIGQCVTLWRRWWLGAYSWWSLHTKPCSVSTETPQQQVWATQTLESILLLLLFC